MGDSSSNTAITAAVIGVVGSIAVALITNWDKFSGAPRNTDAPRIEQSTPAQTSPQPATAQPPPQSVAVQPVNPVTPVRESVPAMINIRELILKTFPNVSGVFTESAFPADKLQNAISAYAQRAAASEVLLLYDDTFWGSAKDGLLLTETGVFWRNFQESPRQVAYDDIMYVEIRPGRSFPGPAVLARLERQYHSFGHHVLVNGNEIKVAATHLPVAQALYMFLQQVGPGRRR
jgi:hypothetical protein